MFAGWLQSCPLQQILQTRTRESAGAHCSFLPLNPRDVRLVEPSAVARTFESIGNGVRFDFAQVRQA